MPGLTLLLLSIGLTIGGTSLLILNMLGLHTRIYSLSDVYKYSPLDLNSPYSVFWGIVALIVAVACWVLFIRRVKSRGMYNALFDPKPG